MEITMAEQKWTLNVETDPETGELILNFPDELLESLGWQEGDVLDWSINEEDGTVTMVRVKEETK